MYSTLVQYTPVQYTVHTVYTIEYYVVQSIHILVHDMQYMLCMYVYTSHVMCVQIHTTCVRCLVHHVIHMYLHMYMYMVYVLLVLHTVYVVQVVYSICVQSVYTTYIQDCVSNNMCIYMCMCMYTCMCLQYSISTSCILCCVSYYVIHTTILYTSEVRDLYTIVCTSTTVRAS